MDLISGSGALWCARDNATNINNLIHSIPTYVGGIMVELDYPFAHARITTEYWGRANEPELISVLHTDCIHVGVTKSYLPAEWRCHHITPIHKSGDRSTITNYRPISLLSCLSKILERLVFDKTSDFIVKTSISNSQFEFVRNHSTLHQLLLYNEFYTMHMITDSKLIRKALSILIFVRLLTQSLM